MLLKPHGRIDLELRAFFVRGSATGSIAVSGMDDPRLTIITPDFEAARSFKFPATLKGISLHPSKPLLAWVNGESGLLKIQKLDGPVLAEVAPHGRSPGTPKRHAQCFHDCCFDESGDFLWAVGPISDDEIELHLVDTSDWSTVQTATTDDRFGESRCSLHGTSNSSLIALWIAAGQDGQRIIWARRRGSKFSCEPADQLVNTTPPVFSPDGSSFVVLNDDSTICKYEFPAMKRIGPLLESEDEDNPFAESMCFLDQRHILASTGEGRIFLIDTERMRIVEEVEVEGHEPRPIGEYYPSLANERGLGTDITWFTRLGSTVVFIYRRDGGKALAGWKDSLLLYSVK